MPYNISMHDLTALQAIDRSAADDETIHMDHNATLSGDLIVKCEASCVSGNHTDYWGTDAAGTEWHIVLVEQRIDREAEG